MFKSLFSTIVGVIIVALAAMVPAGAADDVESKVQVCTACHGQNGEPTDPKTIPIIWGQQQSYLVKELHDFRGEDRQNAIMTPIAKGLALEDLRKIAAYFSSKPWPAGHPAASPPAAPQSMTMCKACHGQNFEGGAPAPRLAGLSYDYLLTAMRNFADGHRNNNFDMPGFMKSLSDSDREAIARYISSL